MFAFPASNFENWDVDNLLLEKTKSNNTVSSTERATLLDSRFLLKNQWYYASVNVFERIVDDFEARFGGLKSFVDGSQSYLKYRFKEYALFIRKKKVNSSLKKAVRESFSDESWNLLSQNEKEAQSLGL